MIYEKRIPDKTKALPASDVLKNPHVSVYKAENIIPYVTPKVPKKNIRRRFKMQRKNSQKGHFLPKAICVFLTIAFVLMTADKYLFCGLLKQTAFFSARTAINGLIEQNSDKNTAKNKKIWENHGKNSLYNNALFSVNSEQNPSAATLSEKGEVTENIPAGNLIENDIPASADGEKLLPITTLSLSPKNMLTLSNETSYKPNIELLSTNKPSSLENLTISGEPLVLILHTHATECYTEHDSAYPENEDTRSQDAEENMISVGEEIAKELSAFGISTLHCTKLHDEPSFINAYSESAKSVKEYLKKHPSIRFIIDVHRDAIIRNDGESIRLVNTLAKEDYAQTMFVVGTDASGTSHPHWKENLSLALHLQQKIEDSFPGLCRSINLRKVPFNQNLSDGYLLLEVGTSANTLSQAKNTAKAFARSLAKLILENALQQ